jgi:hypothetical protein
MKKFAAGARLCIELIFSNTDGAEFDMCGNETDLHYTSYEIKTECACARFFGWLMCE